MKNTPSFDYEIKVPAIFIQKNDMNLIIPSMVLSTLFTCMLITFVPQLMPLWMQLASTPAIK